MPSEYKVCVLCETYDRKPSTVYNKISTVECEQKIRAAYFRPHNKTLNIDLLNKYVHKTCYKSLVGRMKPISVTKKIVRPRRLHHASAQVFNSNSPQQFLKKYCWTVLISNP
jgi:hypothetical protein